MLTLFGMVWDNTHIISNNVLTLVTGIPESIVGKSGYFNVQDNLGVKILISYYLT